jgi:putative SOS response-associated peptidase YedK
MMNRQQLDWELVGDSMVKVTGPCKFTGEAYSCVVPVDGFAKFMKGEHAQTALPRVSADDREFLISGISPTGWKKAFG